MWKPTAYFQNYFRCTLEIIYYFLEHISYFCQRKLSKMHHFLDISYTIDEKYSHAEKQIISYGQYSYFV
jgi:hypothetical protein